MKGKPELLLSKFANHLNHATPANSLAPVEEWLTFIGSIGVLWAAAQLSRTEGRQLLGDGDGPAPGAMDLENRLLDVAKAKDTGRFGQAIERD